jgi:Heterokaryon incompatibility protein (HET)
MLCGTCKSLNLSSKDFIIQANEDQDSFEHIHDLGSLRLIREKSSLCILCHLIVEAIGGSHKPFSQQDKDIHCQLYWQEDGFFWGGDGPEVRCLRVRPQPWPPSFNEYNRLIPLADDLPGPEGLFFGRKIQDTPINVKHIKKWMKLCQKWHEEDCEQLSTSLDWEFPSNFRMIDAWDRCIVRAPPGCKFLVLSYVWGPVKVFKLLKDNLPQLQVKGALNKVWQNLPKTIQDAITLTSSLSIRHIWIDSLCIVQDDSSDKNSLIPYMHIIYDRAFMTIVAASGEDAQAGLPGVCPKSRAQQQRLEEISPGLRLICPKHIVDALNQSVYESRAWT